MLKLPPITYFDMYLRLNGFEGKFFGVANVNNDGGRTLEITPTTECTEEELAAMYAVRDSYNWDQPDFFMPQIEEFKAQVFAALPDIGKLEMAPVLMAMNEDFIDNPTNMQIYWSAFLANRPSWLTNEIAQQIDDIALACNIPIEVGQKPSWMDRAKSFFNIS